MPAARPGETGGASSPKKPTGPSPWRLPLWLLAFAGLYGLSLTVLVDSLFLLAVPGLIGLVALGSTTVLSALYRPLGADVPYATDGTDHRGVLHHHRSVLRKRYGTLVSVCIAAAALVPVTKSDYSVPLAPFAVVCLLVGTRFWFEQLRSVRLSAGVLDVYTFEFRAPVQTLDLRAAGKRSLRLGGEGEEFPKMSAHQPLGQKWPEDIADGVWFAGDDVFGGVLMVPGSGELMCVQPLAWDELAGERSRAGAERIEKAKRAGLGRRSV